MDETRPTVDFVEAGAGPRVVLVHSSSAGARQWRRLMAELEDRFHLTAPNLFGYGGTPAWSSRISQRLEDQAALVEACLPADATGLSLVGHSFGAAVAMKAAARLGPRVEKLVLLEPNPFYLLRRHGRSEAFIEIAALRDRIVACAETEDWTPAAAAFADYWNGPGTWDAMAPERRETFTAALRPNLHEWDAVMNERTYLEDWALLLPARTLIVTAEGTKRPIREIVELLEEANPDWHFARVPEGGHMAPVTRPDLINPLIAAFLEES